ncbi:S-methyl-5-thioribose-1-phosphate isomerase [Thermodesulfobacterium sp.]|jgi:methylthioribose-1-phosphate isomerase|uniref:S-methyl-5-thioribose-1-phosphate isomerase n=1 Tax=Thermodesulfobacterium sp. TaxID=1965289 RepID=UPI00257FD434|nr:S-methyl-5-thioribose-1-phosphate isomerase [Thermodesulfobacterium sp.]MBZ4681774.1 methylthioribose-phosphate isomerase [Thermodesulfobacterium sp.]MDN5379868.1 methylthioribose-phosphate isomerase [Thermodesulfobacterium sp.]
MKKKKNNIKVPAQTDVIQAWIWNEKGLFLLDQRKLPLEEKYVFCNTINKVRKAIKELVVRGAPAIGICAAIGFTIGFKNFLEKTRTKKFSIQRISEEIGKLSLLLETARPTAVNLKWAVNRMKGVCEKFLKEVEKEPMTLETLKELYFILEKEALKIWEEDIEGNLSMATFGKDLIPEGGVLTHCNTGALATGGYGTALGVIREAYKHKKIFVFVDETRPFLQGARLTAWELSKLNIPYAIITDNSAGYLIKKGEVKAIIVGADRIALNGDTANKIGTYSLAVLAHYHKIPFFVAAPSSTFDLEISSGEEIPIEKRPSKEVLSCGKTRVAPLNAKAYNFAFDITPGNLITAIITEKGVIYPPYSQNIPKIIKRNEN